MTLLLNDGLLYDQSFCPPDTAAASRTGTSVQGRDFHLIADKLTVPKFEGLFPRPRLDEVIEKSLSQYAATLISGRAGTGKTALAAGFAGGRDNVMWYSVESADADWRIFSRYISAGLTGGSENKATVSISRRTNPEVSEGTIARFLAEIFPERESEPLREPKLLVIDDLHHLFDAPWFGNFFTLLMYFLRENTQLLLLCRSGPPGPLWRLRSKQMLNVIDEKILAFNCEETVNFFSISGLPETSARKVHKESFGRVAKVKETASRLNEKGIKT